jgi:predicted amidohydrolase
MKIALPATRHKLMDLDFNLRTIKECAGKSDIVVFPEMFLTGYLLRDRVFRYAQSVMDKFTREISGIAGAFGTTIVCGMPEFDAQKKLVYNSAMIFLPDERIISYRKRKLATFGPFDETFYFVPGNEECIFEVSGVRVGILICYEIFFPEIAKRYAQSGIDLLICISASPSTTKQFFEAVLPARAIENTIFVAYSNLLGTEQNFVFWGGQRIYSPRGELLVSIPPYTSGELIYDIEVERIKSARHLRPTLKDS